MGLNKIRKIFNLNNNQTRKPKAEGMEEWRIWRLYSMIFPGTKGRLTNLWFPGLPFWTFLKRDATFVFLDLQVLSKVIASSLAWTFASLLTPSGAAC